MASAPNLFCEGWDRWNSPYINHFISPDTLVPSTDKGVEISLVVNYSENFFLDQFNKTNSQRIQELNGQKESLRQQINLDPKGFDRYAYANNNPIRYSDPSGHCIWDLCIAEIGFVSIGLVELAAAGGIVALTTYIYGPNGQQHIDAITDSIVNVGESASEDLTSLFARKPDIKFIDYLQKKYGLSEPERRKLHDLITRQGMTEEEIEKEAAELARLRQEKEREKEKGDEE